MTRAQTMLADHLREHYGIGIAKWCKSFWTEAQGRMCLAHSRYAGCKNNIGIEVSWRTSRSFYLQPAHWGSSSARSATTSRPVKERNICNASVKSAPAMHSSANPFRLRKCGMAFSLRIPRRSAAASCTGGIVVMTSSKRSNVPIEFRDMMDEIMECGPRTLALHLKIAAWHDDLRRLGQAPRLDLGELKTILVPRQALLKRLDPTGELSVPTARTQLEPLVSTRGLSFRIGWMMAHT